MRNTRYGLPYQGSKNRYAKIICDLLPKDKEKRFVDLFCGGCAITHYLMQHYTNDYKSYYINDTDELVVDLFLRAIKGDIDWTILDKETFDMLKYTKGEYKLCWSFGNCGRQYLWGKDIADQKVLACKMLTAKTISERRKYYKLFIKSLQSLESLQRLQSLESLQRLQRLESLERLQSLQSLESLQSSSIDYKDVELTSNDIVYCDPPYEPITNDNRKQCDDYGGKFNSIEFYEWVKSKDIPIFFSSYEISDSSFYKIKVAETHSIFAGKRKNTEWLYLNDTAYSISGKNYEKMI